MYARNSENLTPPKNVIAIEKDVVEPECNGEYGVYKYYTAACVANGEGKYQQYYVKYSPDIAYKSFELRTYPDSKCQENVQEITCFGAIGECIVPGPDPTVYRSRIILDEPCEEGYVLNKDGDCVVPEKESSSV